MQFPIVDIFAGPGGLGEGFSSFKTKRSSSSAFKIAVSAEMEPNAARTLRLRAFFRQFEGAEVPVSYYNYVAGRAATPWTDATSYEWNKACEEARQLTLGEPADDEQLNSRISKVVSRDDPWVLIGGPPCQAYSLVGRARNIGINGYRPEADHRHFLYKHYLRIINRFRPAAFVMENVKGLLSAKVSGLLMFPQILDDLRMPGGKHGPRYRIVPLIVPSDALDRDEPDAASYVLRAEEFGVPQARHRVVLLGLAEDYATRRGRPLVPSAARFTVADVINGLPKLRSGITDLEFDQWPEIASKVLNATAKKSSSRQPDVALLLEHLGRTALRKRDPGTGGRWMPFPRRADPVPEHLRSWLLDPRLDGHLNHEVRAHMHQDLMRYAFASAFAAVHGRSPRGSSEFPKALHPLHRNWDSGKFVDRFKVQVRGLPSSTITSHLSKDGHYFIHPDPIQLRSLSVREAARLQSFPDNYFFEGSRGAQFRQVGNAVPPWLAHQIAATVHSYLASE